MTRAVIYRELGSADVWKYIEDWLLRPRNAGEVRIAVKSTSYNPIDSKVRDGLRGPVTFPKVPGGDVAGYVIEADPTSKFKAGDAVFAFTTGSTAANPDGGWAELTNVPEDLLVRAPANLSVETEAGAVPLVAITAFQALDTANLKPGARVLINAGSGGVGHLAVQLAKHHWGAYVVSTSKNAEFVKSIGADEVIDYTKEDFAEKLKGQQFDAIVDIVGGETELKSYPLLKAGGTFAHIRNTGTDESRKEEFHKKWTDKKYTYTIAKQNRDHLQIVADLIAAGKVKAHIAERISLSQAPNVEALAAKKSYGKILIQI